MSELEKQMMQVAKNGIYKAIDEALTGYNSPMHKLAIQVIDDNSKDLYNLINTEVVGLLDSEIFKEELKLSMNKKLAKVLVGSMGGEMEKQVNKLKSDPLTRSRIMIAIEKIVTDGV